MEEELVPRAGLRLETIAGGPVVGVGGRRAAVNLGRLAWSLSRLNRLYRAFRPDVLFMTGGYVTAPAALVAWLRRVPAGVYLPDIEPGAAIKTLSRLTGRIACTAAESRAFLPAAKVVVTGYPVRPEIRAALTMSQVEALARFDLRPGRPTVLVFGGSRGARSLNRTLLAILATLLAEAQVIHVSGRLDWPEVETRASQLPAEVRTYYRPYAYLHEEMGAAYRAADLVVARAGASLLGECPAFGLPAVLVPYPHAWRYQKVNADYLVGRGAAVRLDDERLGQELLPTIQGLLRGTARLAAMRTAARALDRPAAARQLARFILDCGANQKIRPTGTTA